MSSCDLEIVLERPEVPSKVGGTVRGVVGVTVDAPCRCNALTVRVEWYTFGSGDATGGIATEVVLFEGEWKAGEKHLLPFELAVGNGPLSYRGHHLNVGWRVVATADIPWGFDPQATAELAVVDDPDLPELSHGPLGGLSQGLAPAQRKLLLGISAASFAVVGLVGCVGAPLLGLYVAGLTDTELGLMTTVGMGVVPVIIAAVGGGLVFRTMRPLLAGRRLGEPVVTVPARARGGDAIVVGVSATPRQTTEVRGIYAVLSATEWCIAAGVDPAGTDNVIQTHEVWSGRFELADARTLTANVPVRFDGKLQLPSGVPATFGAANNVLEWAVEVHAELSHGPEWVSRHVLVVRP